LIVERNWYDDARFGLFIHWDHARRVERDHDPHATVIAVDLAADPIAGRTAIGVVEAGT
jgi:hypothetical protein